MIKLVDHRNMYRGGFISLLLALITVVVVNFLNPPQINIIIGIIIFMIGVLFTYLQNIETGVEKFKDSTDKSSKWLRMIIDYESIDEFKVEKLLEQIPKIRDNIKDRPNSAYSFITKDIIDSVTYRLTDLANYEYQTIGQTAFDKYIAFFDQLKKGDNYLCTNTVGILCFWQDEKMGKLIFDANDRAAKSGVKVERIFIIPDILGLRSVSLDDHSKNDDHFKEIKNYCEEIKNHQKIGDVMVVLQEDLPDYYIRDFGIFNDKFVGYLDLGPKDSFGGIKYSFDPRDVEKAKQLYKKIAEFDVTKRHGYANLEEYLATFCKDIKDG